jgi:hypothetical protein
VALQDSLLRCNAARIPPELSADIFNRGIILIGNGSLLKNFDKRVHETGLPSARRSSSVVLGAAKKLLDFNPAAPHVARLNHRVALSRVPRAATITHRSHLFYRVIQHSRRSTAVY